MKAPDDLDSQASWVEVGRIDAWIDGAGREVIVGGRPVAVFRATDRVFALAGRCPHQGARLAEGVVDLAHRTLTCPRRGCLRWRFRLEDGTHANGLAVTCPTHAVRVVAGVVWVCDQPASAT